MKWLLDSISLRLALKGLTPVEMKRLINDVLNIISGGGAFTIDIINQKLGLLGWSLTILDRSILELIIYHLENEGRYRAELHTVH